MPRDLKAEDELVYERIAICMADGISYTEACHTASVQLWAVIRESEWRDYMAKKESQKQVKESPTSP